MSPVTRTVLLALISALLLATAGACEVEQQADSTRPIVTTDTDPGDLSPATVREADSVDIYLSADGFRNVQRMCIDGNGVYVTSRGGVRVGTGDTSTTTSGGSLPSGIAVVPQDRGCAQ